MHRHPRASGNLLNCTVIPAQAGNSMLEYKPNTVYIYSINTRPKKCVKNP